MELTEHGGNLIYIFVCIKDYRVSLKQEQRCRRYNKQSPRLSNSVHPPLSITMELAPRNYNDNGWDVPWIVLIWRVEHDFMIRHLKHEFMIRHLKYLWYGVLHKCKRLKRQSHRAYDHVTT